MRPSSRSLLTRDFYLFGTSLEPRLLPSNSIPGFGVQRTLDWSSPIDLVGEGLALPQVTHPSAAVKEFSDRHLRGAAGRIFANGSAAKGAVRDLGGVVSYASDDR